MTTKLLCQEVFQLFQQRSGTVELALPDDQNRPSHLAELCTDKSIAFNVAKELWLPIIEARAGHPAPAAAGVHMPKTTMDKDYFRFLREDNIGTSGKVGAMKPIPEAAPVEKTSHQALGCCVLALDAPHVFASAVRRYRIHHASEC